MHSWCRRRNEVEQVLSGIKIKGLEIYPFTEFIKRLILAYFETEGLNRRLWAPDHDGSLIERE
jgi:hypothetical protein